MKLNLSSESGGARVAGSVLRVEDRVRELAQTQPDQQAVIMGGRHCTYRELDEAADRAATALALRGVGPGARVAWLGRNDIAYVVTMLAARRRGACLVSLNWRDQHDGLRAACELVAPTVLIADAASAEPVDRLGGSVSQVVILDPGELPWQQTAADPRDVVRGTDADDCILYFTSGATGRPKVALHSYGAVNQALDRTNLLGFGPGTRSLIIPPVFHVAGAVWVAQSLLAGSTIVFDSGQTTILELIAGTRVTHALMVPTLIQMVLREQERTGRATPSLELVAYGTSPITSSLLSAAMTRLGCSFTQMYGTTEAGGVVTSLTPEDHVVYGAGSARLRSAGRPLPEVEVKVTDPVSGAELRVGQIGELAIRTPWGMRGYWHDPAATAAVLDRDGWLHTHDAAHLDEDGYVYISGRLDDVIITGGENVHPGEVEEVLAALPGVVAAALVGIPDPHWGELVAAAVVRGADDGLTERDVIDFCRNRLAGYKCPRRVIFVEELPRNATGKVVRRGVRELVLSATAG
jgi:acyl-CoA synthetase (AMP-forming)/AMP-acid ligase II